MTVITPNIKRPLFDLVFVILIVIGIFLTIAVYRYTRIETYPSIAAYRPDLLVPLWIIGGIVLIGVGLPRWIERGTAVKLAKQVKKEERQKWGFCGRDREGPWINYIDYPLVRKTDIAIGKRFYAEWLIVHEGEVIVNPGKSVVNLYAGTVKYDHGHQRTYAWDGCTPKRWFLWITLIGTPDWKRHESEIHRLEKNAVPFKKTVFWQQAHHASLVHDALYQYLDTIPIAKADVDRLFYEMLRESGFSYVTAKLYHLGVRVFGGCSTQPNGPAKNSCLKMKNKHHRF